MRVSWSRDYFASHEEYEFYLWCLEGITAGIIGDCEYQPEAFELSPRQSEPVEIELKTKFKTVEKFLLHPHSYQADFRLNLLYDMPCFYPSRREVWVDTKGGWANRGARQEFSINQKWVYEKYGIYVNKIVPHKLFLKTWCPKDSRRTPKTKKTRKKFRECLTVKQYLETLKSGEKNVRNCELMA